MAYIGYSQSERALEAKEAGRKPLSHFVSDDLKIFNQKLTAQNLPPIKTLKLFKSLLKFYAYCEWHHTSSKFNQTSFYDAERLLEEICKNPNIVQDQQKLDKEQETPKKESSNFYLFEPIKITIWGKGESFGVRKNKVRKSDNKILDYENFYFDKQNKILRKIKGSNRKTKFWNDEAKEALKMVKGLKRDKLPIVVANFE
ncbi:hypothetical protein [Helicobacter sp. 11S02596-1]|uniref:hypothetical protein n=1 Tax=Helicobacter sp. 11S02596-1 TaxID=1476194 RepID=UPI000BA78421|nr:hypothetical protein [Helicobacter sp. 11S02596-1]PAF41211.1 hypothetical protein BJI48_08930 [Helicobacter sp. 11S02596-1]